MSGGHATNFPTQAAFASGQPHEGSPVTEFRRTPDRVFLRKFFNRRLLFPDGAEHEIWGFEDETSGRGLPSPLVRVTEGQVVHGILKPSKRVHTIHWHGIEPDPRNDGVGHTSFEVTGEYTYQWLPEPGTPADPNAGAAGTYFYHCHVNTVLHVQMGMLGPVIIDPIVHKDFPVPPGTRRSFVDGPPYDIATETLLVPYSVDPRWHQLDHAAGLSGEDVGLNRFEPKHFYVLGGNLSKPVKGGGVQSLREVRANVAGKGAPTLLRTINANYFPTRLRFTHVNGSPITDANGKPVKIAEAIAHDGRAFRDTSSPTAASRPVGAAGHPLETNVLAFGAAERYDMLLHPPAAGEYRIHVDWTHWVTGKLLATRTIPLIAG
jgi:FtsP/CotA-like multicopper oxidase with cupredoxin domain